MTVPKGATAVVGGVQSLPRRVEHFRAPTHRHAMAPLTHPAIIQTLEESVKTKRAAGAGRGTAAAGRGTQELLTGVSRSFWQGGGTIGSEFYARLGQAVRYPYRP